MKHETQQSRAFTSASIPPWRSNVVRVIISIHPLRVATSLLRQMQPQRSKTQTEQAHLRIFKNAHRLDRKVPSHTTLIALPSTMQQTHESTTYASLLRVDLMDAATRQQVCDLIQSHLLRYHEDEHDNPKHPERQDPFLSLKRSSGLSLGTFRRTSARAHFRSG